MGINQVVYIRTDGNTDIATGHIMRCLTIANALKKKGASVVFLVADKDSEDLLSERMDADAFQIVNLRTDYRDTDEELPVLCQFLMSYPGNLLLIDSYFVTPGYLETLSRLIRVAYLDDLYAFPYPVDTVINYDLLPDPNSDCYSLANKKCLGAGYTPLREMFSSCDFTIRQEVSNILFTAGGMNDGSLIADSIRTVLSFYADLSANSGQPVSCPKVHILLGGSIEQPSDAVKELTSLYPEQIVLHGFVSEMASFLCNFDVVFSAAGTTLYEVCALGIPTISYVIADNQIPSAVDFANAGLVPCLGDLRKEDPERTSFLKDLLTALAPVSAREACSKNMTLVIDKKGAERIADALLL